MDGPFARPTCVGFHLRFHIFFLAVSYAFHSFNHTGFIVFLTALLLIDHKIDVNPLSRSECGLKHRLLVRACTAIRSLSATQVLVIGPSQTGDGASKKAEGEALKSCVKRPLGGVRGGMRDGVRADCGRSAGGVTAEFDRSCHLAAPKPCMDQTILQAEGQAGGRVTPEVGLRRGRDRNRMAALMRFSVVKRSAPANSPGIASVISWLCDQLCAQL